MNIVIIQITGSTKLHPQQEADLNSSFQSLRTMLSDGGSVLLADDMNRRGCFLVSTTNLLVALRKAERVHPHISIQVFSLTSPEAQLLDTVTESNRMAPESYSVAPEFPKA
jgi:hypothetical protein